MWAGSLGAMRVWWNNQEIVRDDKYRELDSDRFAAPVTLRSGWNRLLVKVCNTENTTGPMLPVRVAGPDGAPDAFLESDADPSHSLLHAGAAMPLGRGAPALGGGGSIEGSIQAFERVTRGEDPRALEAYARFLAVTQSDDTTGQPRARAVAARGRKGADHRAPAPRGRARREPESTRALHRPRR